MKYNIYVSKYVNTIMVVPITQNGMFEPIFIENDDVVAFIQGLGRGGMIGSLSITRTSEDECTLDDGCHTVTLFGIKQLMDDLVNKLWDVV